MKSKERVPERKTTKRRMSDVRIAKTSKPKTQSKSARSSYRSRSIERYEHQRSPMVRFSRSLGVILVLIAAVAAVGAFVFQRAHVVVTPHVLTGHINTILQVSEASVPGVDLVYKKMRVERSLSDRIPVDSFETEEQRAFGDITIFNEEAQAQDLAEETRFEAPGGQIFKLAKGGQLRVPAASGDTPGSVVATVYAEKPGEEYNIDATDFVIPGWREIGNSKFETQYARSTAAMSGGGAGRIPVVDDAEKERITQELRTTLTDQIIAQAWVQAPDHFVFFQEAAELSFDEPQLELVNVGGSYYVDVVLGANFETLLFEQETLGRIVGRFISDEYAGEPVIIDNRETLSLTLGSELIAELGWAGNVSSASTIEETEAEGETAEGGEPVGQTGPATEPTSQEMFALQLEGDPQLRMSIDADSLAESLSGQRMRDLQAHFEASSTVQDAEVAIRPFWKIRLPRPDRITIVINDKVSYTQESIDTP